MGFMDFLVRHRRRRWAKEMLALYGVEIDPHTQIGRDFRLVHRGFGTVIHGNCTIGDRVQIYHQVAIGRADGYRDPSIVPMARIMIGDDVVLFPGAKLLGGPEALHVGRGTIVGANAVLLQSTGEYEIWAGIPARRAGLREAL